MAVLAVTAAFSAGCADKGPEPSPGAAFSAVLVMEFGPDTEPIRHRINFTRDMQRLEMISPGSGVTIVRGDMGVVLSLMDDKKMFIELPLRPENKNPLVYMPDEVVEYEVLAEETMDGHPALKERMTIQNEGDKPKEIYRWFAKDIGWPVRAEAADGSWKLHYEDIVTGPQDPRLFEVPADYKMIMARKPRGHATP